jgi:hypothetical protein
LLLEAEVEEKLVLLLEAEVEEKLVLLLEAEVVGYCLPL